MLRHIFAFEPPAEQPARWPGPSSGQLLLASALWLLIYGWLGYRLWLGGLERGLWFNLALTALCVGLGVYVALGWRTAGSYWANRLWRTVRRVSRQRLTLEELRALTPSEFEAYVARYFEAEGYHVVNVRDTKDGGVDVLITDPRGHQEIVQCKRYRSNVGEPVVRDLYGTMIHMGATHAYLITTAGFSQEARRWAAGKPITLIDGPELVARVNEQDG
jgi:hypothetical protein